MRTSSSKTRGPGYCFHCSKRSIWPTCRECYDAQMAQLPMGAPPSEPGLPTRRRQKALSNNYTRYPDLCAVHGVGSFLTNNGLCTRCDTSRPINNPTADQARVLARRRGERTYMALCKVHGFAHFWTQQGKCTGCYRASGSKRPVPLPPDVAHKPPAPRGATPRAAARRAGVRDYFDKCATHGAGLFWVLSGRCKACAHENGTPRILAKTS